MQKSQIIYRDNTTRTGTNTESDTDSACKYGPVLNVAKFHDYFTSCLPGPQKATNTETIPLTGILPVNITALTNNSNVKQPLILSMTNGNNNTEMIEYKLKGFRDTNEYIYDSPYTGVVGTENDNSSIGYSNYPLVYKSGLTGTADTSYIGIDINQLRQHVAIQHIYETDARCGTRYTEIIEGHFGVHSPDARLQRPEYLGGKRIPINIDQVVQTSQTATTPQGNVTAYSLTGDSSSMFTKSFTEHGYIIGLCCVRAEHTYQQGLNRMWSRKERFDFFWPELANIGEQAVLNQEIYQQGTSADTEGFGFQEAWAEYRYKPSIITGQMRSNATGSLDIYHLGDNYASKPVLGKDWIKEGTTNLDRTLAVTSSTADQFIADFYFKLRCARPMPVYSIPGLKRI